MSERIEQRQEQFRAEAAFRTELEKVGGRAALVAYEKALSQAAGRQHAEQKREKASKQNKGFTQVYEAGWIRLQNLLRQKPELARLYAFFAEHMGPDGTLCVSRQILAELLGVSEKTVSRHARELENQGAIVILKVGNANVYCLDPAEVWKSFDNAKPYAAFNTRTLVGKTENPFVKKRLATLLNGQRPEQPDMFSDAVEWPEEDTDTSELDDNMTMPHAAE